MTPRILLTLIFASALTGCTVNVQAPASTPAGTEEKAAPANSGAPAAPIAAGTVERPVPTSNGAPQTIAPVNSGAPAPVAPVPVSPVSTPETAPVGDGPTEADVRRLVTQNFTTTYKESYMKDEEFSIEFGDMSFAPPTKKNITNGYYDQPIDVWPVRMDVMITWRRGEEVRTWPRGTQNNESFSFFKDDFGGWSYRTSGL